MTPSTNSEISDERLVIASADIDRQMMEASEKYVQDRFPQMVLQPVGAAAIGYYDAAQMRAAYRSGYDYAVSLSRRSASNAGGADGWTVGIESAPVACTLLATYFDEEFGEWIVQIFVADKPTAPFTHWQFITSPTGTAAEALSALVSPPVEEPVPQGSCASCNGTGDTGGNPSYGMCPDCDGTGKFPPSNPKRSPSVSAEVTESAAFLIDRLDDFERGSLGDDIEDACRDFDGHVSPAIERLRSSLNGGRDNG